MAISNSHIEWPYRMACRVSLHRTSNNATKQFAIRSLWSFQGESSPVWRDGDPFLALTPTFFRAAGIFERHWG